MSNQDSHKSAFPDSLHWLAALLARKKLEPGADLVNPTSNTLNHQQDLLLHLDQFLRDDEWVELGKSNWQVRPLDINRHLFSVAEAYQLACHPDGPLRDFYGFQLNCLVLSDSQVSIEIPEPITCLPVLWLLIGDLISLPQQLGAPAADVSRSQSGDLTRLQIQFEQRFAIGVRLRQWFDRKLGLSTPLLQELLNQEKALAEALNQSQHKLAAAEADQRHFKQLFSALDEIWWVIDSQHSIVEASERFCQLTGSDSQPLSSDTLQQVFPAVSYELLTRFIAKDPSFRMLELELLTTDGPTWVEVSCNPMGDGHAFLIARDIQRHKQTERELEERQDTYRVITATSQDGIVSFDSAGTIAFLNPAMQQIFGHRLSDMLGQTIKILLPDLELNQLFDPGAPRSLQLAGRHHDGRELELEVNFASHHLRSHPIITGIVRDISQRIRLEQEQKELAHQLQVSQKMESMGQLAGGIAHDFNNLLVAIMGYAELTSQQLTDPTLQSYLNEVSLASRRAADMTQKLLAFSRQQTYQSSFFDLKDLVTGVEALFQRLLPEDIQVSVAHGDLPLPLFADTGQLEQVLVNLVVNARDAMPGGGALRIETRLARADELGKALDPAQSYGCIQITDSGEGMSQAVLQNIFEPFFTTKPEGAGTGLGLAVVHGIVTQHQGDIEVNSEAGAGTSFRIYLPLVTPRPQAQTQRRSIQASGGSETIMIVEDEDQIRELARLILTGAGYSVVTFNNGADAVKHYEEASEQIDLILTDVVMPEMGGRETSLRIWALNPTARILFTSGYPKNTEQTRFILDWDLPFVQKPYHTEQLRTAVRDLLDRPQRSVEFLADFG